MVEKQTIQITSTKFIKEDLFLALLVITLFIVLFNYLHTTILVHQYGIAFKPKVYLSNFL
jgi:hypothetical protein